MLMTLDPLPNAARRNVSLPSPMRSASSRPTIARTFAPSARRGDLLLPNLVQPRRCQQHPPRDDAAPRDVHRLPQFALGADDFEVVVDAVREPVDRAAGLDAHHLADLLGHRRHVAAARAADVRQAQLVRLLDGLGLGGLRRAELGFEFAGLL